MFKVRLNSGRFVHYAPLQFCHGKKKTVFKIERTRAMTEKQRIIKNYKGFIEEWKIALILAKAQKMGFAKQEWEDIVQEVVLKVKNFQNTPNADASEATLLAAAITHWLIDMLRSQAGKQKSARKFQELRESITETDDLHQYETELPIDVHSAINRLQPENRQICLLFMKGLCSYQIIRQFHWSNRKLRAAIQHIQCHFTKLKLNQYAGGRWNE